MEPGLNPGRSLESSVSCLSYSVNPLPPHWLTFPARTSSARRCQCFECPTVQLATAAQRVWSHQAAVMSAREDNGEQQPRSKRVKSSLTCRDDFARSNLAHACSNCCGRPSCIRPSFCSLIATRGCLAVEVAVHTPEKGSPRHACC